MADLAVRADALRREIPEVVDALCQFAAFAEASGDRWCRDASIQVAAFLIGENGGAGSSEDPGFP